MNPNFVVVNLDQEFQKISCSSKGCCLVLINNHYNYCECKLFDHYYQTNCVSRCFYRFTLNIDCYTYICNYDNYGWLSDESIELEEGTNDDLLYDLIFQDNIESKCKFYIRLKETDKNLTSISKIFREISNFCDNHSLKYNIQLI